MAATAPKPHTDHAKSPPSADDEQAVARLREARARLKAEIAKTMVGQDEVIENLLVALLCRGHALMIGVPGLGKSLMARTLARALHMEYRRIQFTPDLMPADITGTNLIVDDGGGRAFRFQPGPIFANLVLADEINRATPKTQSALLEAMQDRYIPLGMKELVKQYFSSLQPNGSGR